MIFPTQETLSDYDTESSLKNVNFMSEIRKILKSSFRIGKSKGPFIITTSIYHGNRKIPLKKGKE